MLVLDTHALVWWATDPDRLGRKARVRIDSAERLGVPAIVFWEVSLLVRKGKLDLDMPVREWTEAICSIPRMEELPLTAQVAVLADSLQMHADPTDRFIVASAVQRKAPLVTKDNSLRRLRFVKTIW